MAKMLSKTEVKPDFSTGFMWRKRFKAPYDISVVVDNNYDYINQQNMDLCLKLLTKTKFKDRYISGFLLEHYVQACWPDDKFYLNFKCVGATFYKHSEIGRFPDPYYIRYFVYCEDKKTINLFKLLYPNINIIGKLYLDDYKGYL